MGVHLPNLSPMSRITDRASSLFRFHAGFFSRLPATGASLRSRQRRGIGSALDEYDGDAMGRCPGGDFNRDHSRSSDPARLGG
jgi:hypothetical protein